MIAGVLEGIKVFRNHAEIMPNLIKHTHIQGNQQNLQLIG